MTLDPFWGNTKILINAEGGLVDVSSPAKTIFGYSSATVSTAQSKFGTKSINFADGAAQKLYLDNAQLPTMGTLDLTIECWVYQTQRVAGHSDALFRANYTSGTYSGRVQLYMGDALFALQVGDAAASSFVVNLSLGTLPALNAWHHIAVTRSSDVWTVWLNGASVGSATGVVNIPATTATEFAIGAGDNSLNNFDGYIDEFRYTSGVARYATAFSVPTAAFSTMGSEMVLALPALTLVGVGTDATIRGNFNKTLPALSLSASSGSGANLTLRAISLVSSGHNSYGEQAAFLTLPTLSLSAQTGANAALALPVTALTATGTATSLGVANLTLPATQLSAQGTVSGMASAALRTPTFDLVGYSGAVCSVTLTGGLTLAASGTTGGVASASITLPLFALESSATAQNHGSANLLIPALQAGNSAQAWLALPSMTLTAIGHAVVAATYEAYATNLKHNPQPGVQPVDEVTHYTNFPFTHVVRYKDSYYGANSTGLYLLEGTTDDATPITWDVKTATTDFKSPQNKTVASAYFGGRLGPADTITLHAGEGAKVQAYSYTTPRGALAQNYRQVFGKGIKQHRYYALEASGTGELALDDISLDVHNLSRRI